MISRRAFSIGLGTAKVFAQSNTVIRKDPLLDYLVQQAATIEKVAGGFTFTEGPLWLRDGSLIFSDVPNNVIHRLDRQGKVTEFLRPSGYDKTDAPKGAFIGSNGLTLDYRGRVIICQHGNGQIVRRESDGKITVLASKYEGKRLNSPNDVVFRSDGSLYFTDPPYGFVDEDKDKKKELPFNGVYRLKDDTLTLLNKDMTRPNGLAFSPDQRILYVANSDPAKKIWMQFDVNTDGTLGAGRVFYDVTSEKAPGLPDGMKVDKAGNLFATGPGGVWVFSPLGKHLGTIVLPETPANVNWGEADARTLYITAETSVYKVRLSTAGLRP